VRGLSATADGLTLELDTPELARGVPTTLRFRVRDSTAAPLRDFDVEHDKRMHLIVVRRDLTGFQHLHPTISNTGTWSARLTLPAAGSYRVFADFKRDGRNQTLARSVNVAGRFDRVALPAPASAATTEGDYTVRIDAGAVAAGTETTVAFSVTRRGRPVTPQPYLGARGHLVALRWTDLAYLHVHPTEAGASGRGVRFATEFPTIGRYRLFLQFKHDGRVRTAAFTANVTH
jgi:hypothetical protein